MLILAFTSEKWREALFSSFSFSAKVDSASSLRRLHLWYLWVIAAVLPW